MSIRIMAQVGGHGNKAIEKHFRPEILYLLM